MGPGSERGRFGSPQLTIMVAAPVPIALCSFSKETGWRCAGVSKSDSAKISIFAFGQIKLLKIPIARLTTPGRFCNPKILVEEFCQS